MEILYREIKEEDILTQKKKYLNYLSYFLKRIKKRKISEMYYEICLNLQRWKCDIIRCFLQNVLVGFIGLMK